MEDNNNGERKIVDKVKDFMAKEGKKVISKVMKKIIPLISPYIGLFAVILLVVGLINAIPLMLQQMVVSVSATSYPSNPDTALSTSATESVIYIDDNGAYKLKSEDIADQLLKELEKQKVNTELMGLKEDDNQGLDEDMIEKYIKAEVQTTFPKTGCFGNDVDGTIIIKRATSDGTIKNLTYTSYNDFCNKVTSQNTAVLTQFSLNPDTLDLCIARNGSKTEYRGPNGELIRAEASEAGIVKEEINYQKYVQNYAVPLNFFISLHLVSQDVDFMQELLDMVIGKGKDEPIVLTYVDSYYQSTTEYQYSGNDRTNFSEISINENDSNILMPETMTEEEFQQLKNNTIPNKSINNSNVGDYIGSVEYYKKNVTSYAGRLYVSNADTWLKTSGRDITEAPSTDTSNTTSNIIKDYDKSEKHYKLVNMDADTLEITSTYWRQGGHVTITETVISTNTSKSFTVVDKESKINVDKFVELIKRYPKVENNFKTAPSNIFYLLQQSQNTQKLEKIMRYVMFVLNDIDYGVTEADLEVLLAESFIEGGMSAGNLADYLLAFSHAWGYEAPQSGDGKYYKMYGDGKGWPTIGNADIQWASHQGKFSKPGKIMHKGQEMEVANVADYVNTNCLTRGATAEYSDSEVSQMEIYIEKELVDAVGEQIQQVTYDYVISQTTGLNLTRQQIYPLVAISYNFGYLPERNGRTFKEAYLEASAQFEEFSWEHNRYIWDFWWNAIGGGAEGHIPSRDAQFETYVKGVFDYSLSDAGTPFARKYYIYYTLQQKAQFIYAPNKTITRNTTDLANEEKIFTTAQYEGEFTPANEKYIAGYYTSTTGRKFTILNQLIIDSWDGRCNRAASAIIASGYSEQTPYELITTMNANYDNLIPTNKYWNIYGLKRVEHTTKHIDKEQYTEIIRNQFKKGGYVALWVDSNGNGYRGKSGEKWTKDIHWMAIIDYRIKDGKEQIVIADWRGADWYDIDEFENGIDAYALINED